MKQNLWLALVTSLAYCLDKELWKAIDYLKEQVRTLKEQREKDQRIIECLGGLLKSYHPKVA